MKSLLIALSILFLSTAAFAGTPIRATGVLVVWTECIALQSDDGILYTLSGDLSGDLEDFKVGDRVVITGEKLPAGKCAGGIPITVTSINVSDEPIKKEERSPDVISQDAPSQDAPPPDAGSPPENTPDAGSAPPPPPPQNENVPPSL